MKNSISRISLFFFIFIYSYFSLRIFLFPHLYDSYGAYGIFICLFIFLIIMLVFLIVPKRLFNIFSSFEKSKIKKIIKPLLISKILLSIMISSYALKLLYFNDISLFIIAIGMIIPIVIISRGKPSDIISISTIFGIVSLISYIFYFYDFIDLDYSLMFNMKNFNLLTHFYIFFFILDFSFLLLSDSKASFNKRTIIIGLLISFLLFSFEYLILSLTSGDTLFLNNSLSGFMALFIQPVSRYSGTFEYVSIIGITISVIFKNAFFLSLVGNKNKIDMIIYFLLFIVLLYFLYKVLNSILDIKYIIFIVTGFLSVLIIWLIKEAFYAKLD